MSDLGERLARLGLSQYLESLVAEGFDTWETVLDITESDLSSLNVKLGHRRKLQRAIAESRGQSSDRPLPFSIAKGASADGSYRSDDSAPESKGGQGVTSAAGTAGTSTKRKYRRHPKVSEVQTRRGHCKKRSNAFEEAHSDSFQPDEHAPERPPSAYVIFSNQVRETLKGQELSFTEIAKVVGERWQILPADEREACERQANAAKEKYYAELAEYKKTPQFEAYQKYLEEFKAKHAAPPKGVSSKYRFLVRRNVGLAGAEGKRSKLETEASTSTRSSSHEQGDRNTSTSSLSNRRVSSTQSDVFPGSQYRSESSPPIGPARLPSGPSYPSKSTSPATHSLSGLNSPRVADQYSPLSASPRSASLHKENSHEMHPSALARDARGPSENNLPMPSMYGLPHPQSSTTPPSAAFGTHYQNPIDLPSRRSFREPHRLPPLTHDDTTLSSESERGPSTYNPAPYPGSYLPAVDPSKSMRVLPQPVPSLGPTASPLDRHPPPPSTSPQHPDYRTSSSLAALLRAGELARVADDESMAKEISP
ncbi:hypothetical protein BS50DRAFT_589950 [Corynespora cassiicola Philippines]|uniref:HMG box domain-containing protein n=1 Tax=Corynespora cassiicola Philippines TaxID=1448308 RepID=A0A2T2NJF3_CORCC|nr:hypothetical protein BS50DRAFT_589950 [Corynespora cassiicola Philippines]